MSTYIFSIPTLTPMGSENRYQLAENWLVRAPGMDFTVPKGFIFDGASIPRALWRLCGSPYDAPRVIAALAHDFLYATHICTRKEADVIYRDMQIDLGITAWKARVEYGALRIFGRIAWNNHGTMNHLAALVLLAAISLLLDGCASKTRSAEFDGLYASETGTLAIGSVEVSSAPQGEESAIIKYEEDNAWLAPSMKKHKIKITLTGTNSVDKVDSIVKHVCEAFTSVADKGTKANKETEETTETNLTKKGT